MASKKSEAMQKSFEKIGKYLDETEGIETADKAGAQRAAISGVQVLRDVYIMQIDASEAPDAVKEQSKVVSGHLIASMIQLLETPDAENFGFGEEVAEVFNLVQSTMVSKNSQYLEAFSLLLPSILKVGGGDKPTREQIERVIKTLSDIADGMQHVQRAYQGFKTMTEATFNALNASSAEVAAKTLRAMSDRG